MASGLRRTAALRAVSPGGRSKVHGFAAQTAAQCIFLRAGFFSDYFFLKGLSEMTDNGLLPEQTIAASEEALSGADVPDDLDEYGQSVWVQMTPILVTAGRLKKSDFAAWKRYCHLAGRYWRAAADIKKAGSEFYDVPTVAVGPDGKAGVMSRRRPACLTMEKLLPELRQQEDRFGMSPLSRVNLVSKGLRGGFGNSDLFGNKPDNAVDQDETPDPSSFN